MVADQADGKILEARIVADEEDRRDRIGDLPQTTEELFSARSVKFVLDEDLGLAFQMEEFDGLKRASRARAQHEIEAQPLLS